MRQRKSNLLNDEIRDPELGIAAFADPGNTHNRKAAPGHTFSEQKSSFLRFARDYVGFMIENGRVAGRRG